MNLRVTVAGEVKRHESCSRSESESEEGVESVFYFFMIRPQQKRQKEEKKFRDALTKGQNVVTIGGLHGKIAEVKETTVLLEVSHDVRIEVEKTAIAMSVAVAQK